jgi:ribonuclease BN (tRNA processing enzyme)
VKGAAERYLATGERGLRLVGEPGRLELSFLGVGAAFATTMLQSNLLVVKGRTHLMIDLGGRASAALHAAGLSALDVENLAVTHSHADHVGGIEEWCLKARYASPRANGVAGAYRPRLYVTAEYARILWDATLRGGLEHGAGSCAGARMSLEDYVELRPCGPVAGYGRPVFRAAVGEGADAIDLKLMRTTHIPGCPFDSPDAFYSVGALLDDRVLVSGDTLFDEALVEEFGAAADAIFHDCQEFRGGVHASYGELAALRPALKEKMFLYHLSDGEKAAFSPEADGFAGWAVDQDRKSVV